MENLPNGDFTVECLWRTREMELKRQELATQAAWECKAEKFFIEIKEIHAMKEIEAREDEKVIEKDNRFYDDLTLASHLRTRATEFEKQKLAIKTIFEEKTQTFLKEIKEICAMVRESNSWEVNYVTEMENLNKKENTTKKEKIIYRSSILAPLWKIGESDFKKQELAKTAILEEQTQTFLKDIKEICAMENNEAPTVDSIIETKAITKKKYVNFDVSTLASTWKTRETELKTQELIITTACQERAQKFYNEVKKILAMEKIEVESGTEEENGFDDYSILLSLWRTREAVYKKQRLQFQTVLEERSQTFFKEVKELCAMRREFNSWENINEEENITIKENMTKKENIYDASTLLSSWTNRETEFRKQELTRKIILQEQTQAFLTDIKELYAVVRESSSWESDEHSEEENILEMERMIENETALNEENITETKTTTGKKSIRYTGWTLARLWTIRQNEIKKQEMARKAALEEKAENYIKVIKEIYAMEINDDKEKNELNAREYTNTSEKVPEVEQKIREKEKTKEISGFLLNKNLEDPPIIILETEDSNKSDNRSENIETLEASPETRSASWIPRCFRTLRKKFKKGPKERKDQQKDQGNFPSTQGEISRRTMERFPETYHHRNPTISDWTEEDVSNWLCFTGMDYYSSRVHFDGWLLLTHTKRVLKSFDNQNRKEKKILLKKIKKLQRLEAELERRNAKRVLMRTGIREKPIY
ncbi:uncharacterized protein LOC110203966 isoform X4 [Phascolarctos cinereus]